MAKEFREAGNKEYSAKKFGLAVKLYTVSAMHAPPASEALALAYANRSAVLVQMKKYSSALKDIRLSVEAGYPTKLRYKLQQRKLQCLLQLGQVDGDWGEQINEYLHFLKVGWPLCSRQESRFYRLHRFFHPSRLPTFPSPE